MPGNMEKMGAIRRTELGDGATAAELRALLTEYFEEAGRLGREYFDDEDWGADVERIVEGDIERLRSGATDRPLFVARVDGRLAGSVQLKRLDDTRGEIKRLYVGPAHRGEGIGRSLVELVLAEARAAGFETLLLGLAPYHGAAGSLYESLGFEYRPAYEENQVPESVEEWYFMERSLDA
jgi:ribosomal protein S18 acetylase RimI-like enzyme